MYWRAVHQPGAIDRRARVSTTLKIRLTLCASYAVLLACKSSDASTEPLVQQAGWTVGVPLPERLQEMHAAALRGDIYLAGGFDSTGAETRRAYRFVVAQNHWERITDLPEPGHHMPLAVLNDTLYAIGGYTGGFGGRANLWLYRADRNTWEARVPLSDGTRGVGRRCGARLLGGRWRHRLRSTTSRFSGDLRSGDEHMDTGSADSDAARPSRSRCCQRHHICDRGPKRPELRRRRGLRPNDESLDDARAHAESARWTRHGLAVVAVGGKIYAIGGGPRAGFAQTNVVEIYEPNN